MYMIYPSSPFPVIVSVRTYPGPLFSRVSLWEGAALCATRASQGSPGEFYYFLFFFPFPPSLPILLIIFYFFLALAFVPNFFPPFDRLGCRLRLARFLFDYFFFILGPEGGGGGLFFVLNSRVYIKLVPV